MTEDTHAGRGGLAVRGSLALAVGVLALTLGTGNVPATVNASPGPILVSKHANRDNAVPLAGRQLVGKVQIFVRVVPGIARVRFYIDDPSRAGSPRRVARKAPYDLVGHGRHGAYPFDTNALSGGRHTITAAVDMSTGRTAVLHATFIASRLYLTPTGSDGSKCTLVSPCLSFDRAYALAQPGERVDVAAGEYGGQQLSGTKEKPDVQFRLASSTHLTGLGVSADNVEVDGGAIDSTSVGSDSSGFTSRNTNREVFGVFGADNVSFIGGDAGPWNHPGIDSEKNWIQFQVHSPYKEPTNVLIDGVYFHDWHRGYDGDHAECLFIVGGNGITIRNSRFQNCDFFSIFGGAPWFGDNLPPMRNVTIENNVFGASTLDGVPGAPDIYYSVRFSSDWKRFDHFRFAYNSAALPIALGSGSTPTSDFKIVGNAMPNGNCMSGVTYSHNVFAGTKCSRSDKLVSNIGFRDAGQADFRLKRGSPAINAGDPKDFPRTDIFGHRRPLGRAPDAGAVESR